MTSHAYLRVTLKCHIDDNVCGDGEQHRQNAQRAVKLKRAEVRMRELMGHILCGNEL